MNKETRTWLTGVLIYFVGMYGLKEINFDEDILLCICLFMVDITL